MKKLWNDLLNLFFPHLCLLCKTPLVEGEEHICLKCLCDLPRTGYDFREENPATYLFAGKAPRYRAAAFLHYEKGGHVQQLIHALKYYDNYEIGYYLGRLMGQYYQEALLTDLPDVLLPVPLHPKKQRKRGYNQAEWIARGVNDILNLPIDTTSCRRTKETDTQTRKQVYERWENVQDIFTLSDSTALAGKHILLIDDVITTGSTLAACAQTLLTIPNTRVSVLAVAIAQ